MNTKFIFLDIDGTLVDFTGKMPQSSKIALEKAHNSGHKLVICTGRQLSQVYPWLLAENRFDGLILSGGAMVINDGHIIYQSFIENDRLKKLMNYFDERRIAYYLQTKNALLAKQWCVDKTVKYFAELGYSQSDLVSIFGSTVVEDKLENRNDIEKIVYYDAGIDLDEVSKGIGDYFHIVGYSFANLDKTSGEISKSGVDKSSGIREYINFFNADMSDTIAFGDGDNDYEMIAAANIGVAMGNATDSLKDISTFVTDDINSDGLYNAFYKLKLI